MFSFFFAFLVANVVGVAVQDMRASFRALRPTFPVKQNRAMRVAMHIENWKSPMSGCVGDEGTPSMRMSSGASSKIYCGEQPARPNNSRLPLHFYWSVMGSLSKGSSSIVGLVPQKPKRTSCELQEKSSHCWGDIYIYIWRSVSKA